MVRNRACDSATLITQLIKPHRGLRLQWHRSGTELYSTLHFPSFGISQDKRWRRVAFNGPWHERRLRALSKAWPKKESHSLELVFFLVSFFRSPELQTPIGPRCCERERLSMGDLNRRANQRKDKFHFTKLHNMQAITELTD